MARPIDYSPDVVVKANEYLAIAVPQNQQIPTVEGLALHLGHHRDTLYEWKKTYPEFREVMNRLKMLQKEHLIQTGIFGGKEVNATIIGLMLKVNHDMVEISKTDITSKGERLPTPIYGGKSGETV